MNYSWACSPPVDEHREGPARAHGGERAGQDVPHGFGQRGFAQHPPQIAVDHRHAENGDQGPPAAMQSEPLDQEHI